MAGKHPARLTLVTLIVFLTGLTAGTVAAADQEALSDDGREVLLRTDGTWEFRSNDRYANTGDDRRVRLKNDGTWEYVGNTPRISEAQVRTTTTDIQLARAVIEKHEKKLIRNTRIRTQSVFYLRVNVSPQAGEALAIRNADPSRIRLRDNKDNDYPVLSVRPETARLTPGSEQTFVIRAGDSPSILSMAKSMILELAPGVFGNSRPIVLNQRISDMETIKVDGFK